MAEEQCSSRSASPSSASGSWAARWPRTSRAAGFELSVWNRTREKAERVRRRARAPRAADTPARGRRGRRRVDHDGRRRARGRGGAARRRRRRRTAWREGALAIDMSTIAPTAARAIGERLADDGIGLPRRPGHRLPAQGRGRHAHDHGRRRARPTSSARRPLFEAMGELIVHVGPRGHGAAGEAAHQHDGRGQRGGAGRGGARGREGRDSTRTPSSRWPPAAPGNSTVLDLKGKPMFERDFTPLFKLEHMLKDVRHCLDEARALGVELRLGALVEPLLRAGRGAGPRRRGLRRRDPGTGIAENREFPLKRGRAFVRMRRPASRPTSLQMPRRGVLEVSLTYASCFQGMGCDRARARRGRAAPHPPQGRNPRGEQALRDRARPVLPLPDLRPPAERPRPPVAPARARARARGGRVARRTSRPRRRCSRTAASRSPSGCGSAPGPRCPRAT